MTKISPSKALSRLLCDPKLGQDDSGFSPGLALRQSISRSSHALSMWKTDGFRVGDGVGVSSYTRRFIESATTALLLRVDPLRVLALRELQRQGDYQLSKRNLLTVQWAGDIIPKESDKTGGKLVDCDPGKIDRSLFSLLCNITVWQPALENLQNTLTNSQSSTPWTLELLNTEPETFAKSTAGQLNASFSFFSKGIHNEWIHLRRFAASPLDCRKYAGSAIKNIAFCSAIISSSSIVRQQLTQSSVVSNLQVIESEFGLF